MNDSCISALHNLTHRIPTGRVQLSIFPAVVGCGVGTVANCNKATFQTNWKFQKQHILKWEKKTPDVLTWNSETNNWHSFLGGFAVQGQTIAILVKAMKSITVKFFPLLGDGPTHWFGLALPCKGHKGMAIYEMPWDVVGYHRMLWDVTVYWCYEMLWMFFTGFHEIYIGML